MQFKKFPFIDPQSRARNPVLSGYSPMFPNGGFLGDATPANPSQTTIIMRAQPNAPPGFPGFFGWLKSEHPDFYNYAVAALPQAITMTEGHRTGGATLGQLMGLGDDSSDLTSIDTGDIDPGAVPTVNIQDPGAGTSGGIPQASPSTASQIISTLTAAAPSILNSVNQQQIFQTQLSRAAAGLPPLNTSAYGLTTGGVAGLSSGALLGILAVGAVVLVMASKK